MIKKRVAFLMTFLIILSTLGGSVYAESRTFGNEEIKAYALIVEETNNRFGKEIIKIPTESDLQKLNLSKEEVIRK